LQISVDGFDYFNDNIILLYSSKDKYYMYKFNSQLFYMKSSLKLIFNIESIGMTGEEFDKKYLLEFFNVYDYLVFNK